MTYLDPHGLNRFWGKVRAHFGASISGATSSDNYTISLKNDADSPATLGSSVVIPAASLSTDSSPHAGLLTPSEKSKLAGIASGAEVNVQANWNESSSSSDAYIQNKPTIPEAATSQQAPAMDGSAAVGSSANYAKADHVHPSDTSRAPLASPALTGTPTAPTAASGTNTTQIATTAFVTDAIQSATSGAAAYKGAIASESAFTALTNYTAGWYWNITATFTHTLADGTSTITLEPGNMVFANTTSSTYSAGNFDIVAVDTEAIPDSVIDSIVNGTYSE